jgi:hypothetical protein
MNCTVNARLTRPRRDGGRGSIAAVAKPAARTMPAFPSFLRAVLVATALCALPAAANILDEGVVDFVVVEQDDATVYLDIVQHLPWNDDTYRRLDRKVDNYVSYVRNGTLLKQHPEVAGKPIVIRVVYLQPPGPAAVWRLEAVKTRIKPRGLGMTWVALTPPPKA